MSLFLSPEELAAARAAGEARAKAAESAKPAPKPEAPTDLGESAKTFAESAFSGAAGVAMSPLALAGAGIQALAGEESPLQQTGRELQEAATGRNITANLVGMALGGYDDKGLAARDEYAEAARARAEQHQTAAGAGELAGGIAGLFVPTGVGALAGAASKGVTRAVGAGLGGRLASAAARGAVEGAAFGAESAQNEAWVAERRLTGQQVLATAGLSGLLGGALSFGTEGLGELLGAGKERIASAVAGKAESAAREAVPESIAGAVEGGAEAAAPTLGERAAERAKPFLREVTRSDDAAIRQAGKAALGEDMGERMPEFYRDIVRGREIRPRVVDEASRTLTADTDTVMRSSSELADEMVNRASKLEHVEANFRRTPPPADAVPKAREAALQTWAEVKELEESISRDVAESLSRAGVEASSAARQAAGKAAVFSRLRVELARDVKAIAETKSAGSAYLAADNMRRNLLSSLDSIGRSAQQTADPLMGRVLEYAAKKLDGTYRRAADHLFDESVWGAQGAAQKEVNQAWVDFINAKKYAFGDIARQSRERLTPIGKMPEFDIKEGSIASLVDRFGTPAGRDALRSFDQYVSAAERLSSAIGKGYQLSGEKSATLTALQNSVARIRGTLDSVAKDTASLTQAEALFKGGEHSLIGGLLGRGADLAGVSGPAASMRARVTLEVNANRAAKQIQQAVDYVFAPPAKAAATTAEAAETAAKPRLLATVARGAGEAAGAAGRVVAKLPRYTPAMTHFLGRAASPEAAYQNRRDEIISANMNNAERVANAVADSLGPLGRQDPHAAASMVIAATKAAQYLQSKLPSAPNVPSYTPLTNSQRTPDRAEIAAFAELYEAVDRPLQTISKLARGTVSRDQVQAIKAVYPDLYEYMRTATLERLRDLDEKGQEVSYNTRAILDNLLDLDGQGERTLQPDFALKYGAAIRATEPQPSDSAPAPRPRQSTIASRFATGTSTMLGAKP